MELFAFLAAVASDPSALPLWLVVAFAAGMYPVGMLFGCEVCCNYCVNCCPDDIEQVVIEFHLEELGEQVVKPTPWRLKDQAYGGYWRHDPMDEIADPLDDGYGGTYVPGNKWGNAPSFLLTGDTSGARIALQSELVETIDVNNVMDTQWLPRSVGVAMGRGSNTQPNEFVEETATITTFGPSEQVEEPVWTVTPTANNCSYSLAYTTRGSYRGGEPFADYSVVCGGDEGTVIYDVTDGRPEGCNNTCTAGVRREVNHIATSRMENDFQRQFVGPQVQETSVLEVSVPVLAERLGIAGSSFGCAGRHGGDGTLISATATTYWQSRPFGLGNVNDSTAWCQTVRQYTLDTTEQDCVPFENWSYTDTTTDSDGEYEDDLVTFTIESCFGSGFAGRATLPAGEPGVDEGPIGAVEVTNPGTGYAVLGRVEPTVVVTSISGTGADLLITLAEGEDECGRPVWSIDSIVIASGSGDDGGENYIDGENLSVTVEAPGVEVTPASATAVTAREEPELDIYSYENGANADLTFSYDENAGPPKTWTPTGATVDSVGSGYRFGEYVDLVPKTASDQSAGYALGFAQVQTLVSEPTVSLSGGSGAGADLGVTLTSNGGTPETWGISAVSIVAGGSGYVEGDTLTVEIAADDVEQTAASITVASVDGSGAITGITIDGAGEYYYESGHVAALVIEYGGEYYRDTGVLESVTVNDGGSFYLEDDEAPAIVADITVAIQQLSPSAGSGLEVSATVDDDPGSATFGQITGLTIDDAGTNYLAIHSEPSVCHVGAPFRRGIIGRNGPFVVPFGEVDDFVGPSSSKPNRGVLFRRRCPDYTYEISLQAGSS